MRASVNHQFTSGIRGWMAALAAVALFAVAPPTAHAGPINAFVGPWTGPDTNGSIDSVGVDFTVNDLLGITVSQLGIFDDGFNGLKTSHEVSIYQLTGSGGSATGTLVADVTVPAGIASDSSDGPYVNGSSYSGGYRYENLSSSVFLTSGANYTIIGYDYASGSTTDNFAEGGSLSAGTAGEISLLNNDRFDFGFTGPGFPTGAINGNFGNEGVASFTFVSGPVTIPEPASLSLLGLGGLGLLARRRRLAANG